MTYGQLCTEFYDADMRFASPKELQVYATLFDKNDIILEPMCGSGRLLIPLLQLGYTVHGLDRSAHMLESCKRRASILNLQPTLYQGNISDFVFKQKYAGIIIPFSSFQLCYPRQQAYQVLEKFKQLLLPGGKLLMDMFVPWEALYEHGDTEDSVRQVELAPGISIEAKSHTVANKRLQHMLSKTHYTKYDQNIVIAEEDEQTDLLWYYPFEMELMLEKFGYREIRWMNRLLDHGEHMTFIAES